MSRYAMPVLPDERDEGVNHYLPGEGTTCRVCGHRTTRVYRTKAGYYMIACSLAHAEEMVQVEEPCEK